MADLKTIFKDISRLSPEEIVALEEYINSVDALSLNGWNLEFNNKDQYHATIVMSAIFAKAKSSIKAFTGSFSGEVSDNPQYLQTLKNSIADRNIDIEVIFENKPNSNSECLKMLRQLQAENKPVKMYMLKEEYRKKLTDLPAVLNHFTIADDSMFRYETEKEHFKAYCNFDDKATVKLLGSNFDIFRLNSTDLIWYFSDELTAIWITMRYRSRTSLQFLRF